MVAGTEQVCGLTCIRLNASNGGWTNWIQDETGTHMVVYGNPDGTRTTWCPPMKIAPPQMYIGTQSLDSFTNAPFSDSFGHQYANYSGCASFVVKGLEAVTVPAGAFPQCLRATFVHNYTDSWSGMTGVVMEDAWYARGIGIVKRIRMETAEWGGTISKYSVETFLLQSYYIP